MTIEQAVEKFHWFKIGEDGVVELYLDHHSLATFRQCEASFELSMMAGVKGKYKSWNLEFGIIFHKMIEEFYLQKDRTDFDINNWLGLAITLWEEKKMHEQFSEHKMYKQLGGVLGLIAMMGQYAQHFAGEVDRLRIIGVEITFGKAKEVPLGSFELNEAPKGTGKRYSYDVRCYLTGRIDFLMDNGSAIGPLDHKTTANFMGKNPTNSYDPQEGMTGYVFAAQHIIKTRFPELMGQRKVDRIWMNFAQITPEADAMKRFRRSPVFKTEWQLEEYRKRQLRTFHKIYDMLILGERPDWNTAVCNNMFHQECQFRNLHRQNTSDAMLQILKSDFIIAPLWNPEEVND